MEDVIPFYDPDYHKAVAMNEGELGILIKNTAGILNSNNLIKNPYVQDKRINSQNNKYNIENQQSGQIQQTYQDSEKKSISSVSDETDKQKGELELKLCRWTDEKVVDIRIKAESIYAAFIRDVISKSKTTYDRFETRTTPL